MRLSAVVVSYRTGPVLFECLAALVADDAVADIIVVDNGNADADVARLDALARETRIGVLRGQGNVGFARASNAGARSVQGEALLFINPDVVLMRGAAARIAATLATLPAPAIVGGDLRTADGAPDRGSRRDRVTPWRAVVSYSGLSRLGWRDLHRHRDPLPAAPAKVGAVSGALLAMRRADFEALGGFDEAYFLHFEDIDLCRRVEDAGGTVMFQPGAIGTHQRSSSAVPKAWVMGHKMRGLALYLRKFAETPGERALAGVVRGVVRVIVPT